MRRRSPSACFAASRPHRPPGRSAARLLDAQFLQALEAAPASAASWFAALAAGVPGDAYARFMSGRQLTGR